MQAEALLREAADYVVVTYADMPLLTAETLQRVVQRSNGTFRSDDDAHLHGG